MAAIKGTLGTVGSTQEKGTIATVGMPGTEGDNSNIRKASKSRNASISKGRQQQYGSLEQRRTPATV
jgi:hypothetical protein